jgi:tetratricopeptide (TPR) repeat protein
VSEPRHSWLANTAIATGAVVLLGVATLPWWGSRVFPLSAKQRLPQNKVAELQAQVQAYDRILVQQPDDVSALQGTIRAKLQLEDVRGVAPALEKLAATQPATPAYSILLAQTKQYLGDKEAAIEAYRQALNAQKPASIDALQGLVSLLVDVKRPEAAIGEVQKAVQEIPVAADGIPTADIVPYNLLLAQIYAAQKRYPDAISIYEQLTTTYPKDFRPLVAKALVLKAAGNPTAAKSLLVAANALAPAEYKDRIQQLASDRPPTNANTSPLPIPTLTDGIPR